jgi:hypothetical protein
MALAEGAAIAAFAPGGWSSNLFDEKGCALMEPVAYESGD